MTASLDELLLVNVNEYLSRMVGLNFSPARFEDLSRGIRQAAVELEYAEPGLCINDLVNGRLSDEALQVVVRNLTIGETYFFRDAETFSYFEDVVLPELIEKRKGAVRHLRFWSAGCSTGEEPYSMAIALYLKLAELHRWHVTLSATDINKMSLQTARVARYKPWSFRTMKPELVEHFFVAHTDEQKELKPEIRRLVSFAYHNLAAAPFLTAGSSLQNMDVIFCRNVLIYFTRARCQQIVCRLVESLAPGGWLIMSKNDSTQIIGNLPEQLTRVSPSVFRKRENSQ